VGKFPLKKCTYNQPDKNAPKKVKTATIIMLNPEKEVLAKWIICKLFDCERKHGY